MKSIFKIGLMALASVMVTETAMAQIGVPYIHDPATITKCDGKYYTWGTGGSALVSNDGWVWTSGARISVGAAPDMMQIGDRYLCAYSTTGGGLGGGHAGKIVTMWNNTLDPTSPDYKWSEPITVAYSENDEDCDAIDAGLLMTPDGRLFVSFGTYFGFIRMCELNPETGERLDSLAPDINIAVDCEASDIIYNDGWYYLFGTHGTCCDGVNSTYNLVCGRSQSPTGPFIDKVGRDMVEGGGRMFLGARDGYTGAGHFGRYIIEPGVEKVSLHWEADYYQGGRSTLAILPIVWKNGWPEAGFNIKDGVYSIESERRGYALELATEYVRLNAGRGMGGMFGGGAQSADNTVVPFQKLEDVIGNWPAGNIDVRICDYQFRPNQKWELVALEEGTLGTPYYKIVISGTNRALTAGPNKTVISTPEFTGAPEQMWSIDQLTDGTYRIMPKAAPGCSEPVCLISAGDSNASLGKFNMESDDCKWRFNQY
ncbi:MAG: family 43 glycosylhydrolase [Bacteroidaceae bacterium]|nr:family 43 glycosylhydrolase [Bacteroidaceae bacterium]